MNRSFRPRSAPRPGTALVTGASSGIGAETVRQLLQAGWTVMAAARSRERLAQAQQLGAVPVELDLARPEGLQAALEPFLERFGGVDLLVNNAGTGPKGAVEETSVARAQEQLRVNLVGPAELVRILLPGMRARGRGRIVNITSVVASLPQPLGGWYAASKAGLAALTDALRFEAGASGVEVVEVRPGPVATGWQEREAQELAQAPEGPYRALGQAVGRRSAQRAGTGCSPQEVAATILRAATVRRPRARYDLGRGTRASRAVAALVDPALVDAGLRRYFRRTHQSGPSVG